jgi:tetratricopeptide (TPR) repeat protein
MEGIGLQQGTAEFEERLARAAIEQGGDLTEGVRHLARLLHFAPGNPASLALFDKYYDETRGELATFAPKGDAAFEGMRALIWRRQGRLSDAVQLLVEIAHPEYLHEWTLSWLEQTAALESLKQVTLQRLLGHVLTSTPEVAFSTAVEIRRARRWAALCQRVSTSQRNDNALLTIKAGILRKAGLFDEALGILKPSYEEAPDWFNGIAMALILWRKGDLMAASEAFETALHADPDISTCLDAGNMFLEAERWQEARSWYQRALTQKPWQRDAKPSDLFCHWKLTQDRKLLDKVRRLARAGNRRAGDLLNANDDRPYEPDDASANTLRKLLADIVEGKMHDGDTINIRMSMIEAPSNELAFALAMRDQNLPLNIQVTAIQEPDPRQPFSDVRYKLWSYEGTSAKPALPPPSTAVQQAIAELTEGTFNRQQSFARASHVAEQLGVEALREILAVMVYPPPLPAGRDALEFLPRLQLEAMHVAAQVDHGWHGSERREALTSVLFSPTDWTTNAAIDVLAYLAHRNRIYASDVHKLFQQLEQNCPNGGYCCWRNHLYRRWRHLPLLITGSEMN